MSIFSKSKIIIFIATIFFSIECFGGGKSLTVETSLIEIIDRYRVKYHDQSVTDDELLSFYIDDIRNEFFEQKQYGYRFLKGFLPRKLNSPVVIVDIDIQDERPCNELPVLQGPSSNRCLLISGRDSYGDLKNIVIVFVESKGEYKMSNTGSFTRLKK